MDRFMLLRSTSSSIPAIVIACLVAGCGSGGDGGEEEASAPPAVISNLAKPVVQANGELLVPDVATIPTPAPGHSWKLVEQTQENGVDVFSFACTAAGSNLAMSLKILGQRADDFETRRRVMDEHYESLVNTLRQEQCTNLEIARGRITNPIPDWSQRKVAGTRPGGERVVFVVHTVFREHIYFMGGISPSEAKSKEMLDAVVKSIVPAKD